jgi:hypothetical protein
MPIVESTFAALPRDPRLEAQVADHATSAAPAWLWSADGSQILWANAVAAAIFGAEPAACSARRFDSKHPAAIEIMRLAETLPPPGQMRLERLRCAHVLHLTMAEPFFSSPPSRSVRRCRCANG